LSHQSGKLRNLDIFGIQKLDILFCRRQSSLTSNQLSASKRPLTGNVVALAADASNMCGRRILAGGASPDAVGQVDGSF
jgi:hypothetical protein